MYTIYENNHSSALKERTTFGEYTPHFVRQTYSALNRLENIAVSMLVCLCRLGSALLFCSDHKEKYRVLKSLLFILLVFYRTQTGHVQAERLRATSLQSPGRDARWERDAHKSVSKLRVKKHVRTFSFLCWLWADRVNRRVAIEWTHKKQMGVFFVSRLDPFGGCQSWTVT